MFDTFLNRSVRLKPPSELSCLGHANTMLWSG
jgi:hypothetical protein